jgi:hypothetical protein
MVPKPVCAGCGEPLKDGGIELYCSNDACTYERDRAREWARQWKEERELAEYERLKAKFG